MKKTAVILFNLGGPDKLESVKEFLFNLFFDRAIIDLPLPFRYLLAKFISKRRAKKASKIYKLIGGKSPILKITTAQAEALEKELSYQGNYKVFVSMRYWHPMSKEVVGKIKEYGPDEIILLPLYPQFSTTTSGSSLKDFYQKLQAQNINAKTKFVCCYPVNEEFILAHSKLIKQAIQRIKNLKHHNFRILFSAHGLPKKIINAGDPYVFQITASTNAIIKELQKDHHLVADKIDYKICYQSKVGPMEWTSPSLDFEIKKAGLDKKAVIVVPISFVSDHSETLVELDIEYKNLAKEKNVPFYFRIPALNVDGHFIKALSDICQKTSKSDLVCCGGDYGKRICSGNFKKCPNVN